MAYEWGNIPFEEFTKIRGDHTRHIEQLWHEIKELKKIIKLRGEKMPCRCCGASRPSKGFTEKGEKEKNGIT